MTMSEENNQSDSDSSTIKSTFTVAVSQPQTDESTVTVTCDGCGNSQTTTVRDIKEAFPMSKST